MKKQGHGLQLSKFTSKPLLFTTVRNLIFPYVLKLRLFFAEKFEDSKVSFLLENAYEKFLSLPLRIIGVFLFSFSLLSTIIGFYSGSSFNLSNINWSDVLSKAVVFTSSILLFTSKSSIGSTLSSSTIIPILNFQDKKSDNVQSPFSLYSQALFIGLIFGSVSSLVQFSYLLTFLLLCVFFIICYNYPESGVLCIAFAVMFFSPVLIVFTTLITLISFIFKYLRGKRHHVLNPTSTVLSVLILYAVLALSTQKNNISNVGFACALILPILSTNLINSSNLSKKLFTVVYSSCAIKLSVNTVLCLMSLYSSQNYLSIDNDFIRDSANFLGQTNLYSLNFYIVLSLPLMLSLILTKRSFHKKIKYVIPLIFMALPIVSFPDYPLVFTVLLSIIIVISCYKKYFLIFLLVLPSVSSLLTKLFKLLPSDFSRIQTTSIYSNTQKISTNSVNQSNILFGNGIEYSQFSGFNNTISRIVSFLGIFGAIIFIICMIFIISYCVRTIFNKKNTAPNSKEICIGTLGGIVSFLVLSLFYDTFFDITNVFIFFTYISLCIASIKSSQNDYIDKFSIREYHKACGTN